MNRVMFGDCRESMRQMVADGVKVQMCVTSPPYFGLRDYGHAGQLGLEATPEQYIANMVEVFRLVRELLADDGVLWVNIGDSYAASQSNNGGYSDKSTLAGFTNPSTKGRQANSAARPRRMNHGVKPKDLIGIPWLLAFALRADGWYLRKDIIWSKPNPMPESVTDRPTSAHEYIFLLAKSQTYYYDHEAIKEPAVSTNIKHFIDGGADKQRGHSRRHSGFNGRYAESLQKDGVPVSRNKRSVWTVATKPYSGAHFATYPPELIEPCILAGSRAGDIVLDPFFGSGTTGQVALALGRQYIGCELNRDYEPLQMERTRQAGLILEVA